MSGVPYHPPTERCVVAGSSDVYILCHFTFDWLFSFANVFYLWFSISLLLIYSGSGLKCTECMPLLPMS